MNKNSFYHEDMFQTQYERKYAEKRIKDFEEIHGILKPYLFPKNSITILKERMDEYIAAHSPNFQEVVRNMLKSIVCIDFKEFHQCLLNQLKNFKTDKPYVIVIGSASSYGPDIETININKSNFWTILLIYSHLKTKPIDIVFNLKIAVRLYPEIKNFLLTDDCIYSGGQMLNILDEANNDFIDNKSISYQQVKVHHTQDRKFTVHILVPFICKIGLEALNNFSIVYNFDVKFYYEYAIESFRRLAPPEDFQKLYTAFNNLNINFAKLSPIIFQHKIADDKSTISPVLINGQVLDSDLHIPFIEECITIAGMEGINLSSNKTMYCPIPPYYNFRKILSEKLGSGLSDDRIFNKLID